MNKHFRVVHTKTQETRWAIEENNEGFISTTNQYGRYVFGTGFMCCELDAPPAWLLKKPFWKKQHETKTDNIQNKIIVH